MSTLTLIASVATGWHYLVDGLAGLVLAAVVFALAVVIYRTLTRATAISGGDNPAPQ
jgi:membrane-associated phospholipid phosphatase